MSPYPWQDQQPVLAGTGRLADDLYLVAHHEVTGRPYLSSRAAGTGLAGGLLAELLAAQAPAVTLERGSVLPLYRKNGNPVARYARPQDPLAGHVLDLIVAESPPRPVRDWLLFLGKTSAAQVAERLERSGYLTRPGSRIPWRTRRPVPRDGDWSVCALLRARAALDAARTLAPYPALLTGLAVACGLGFRFSNLSDAPVRSTGEVTQVLPRPLQELLVHVQVTADAAVLAART
jgi:Golgi phosphoprotein 3 GPP34